MNSDTDTKTNPSPPRKKTSGLMIFLIIVGIFVVVFGGIGLIISSSISEIGAGFGNKSDALTEKVIIKGEDEIPDKIALISMFGAIGGGGSEHQGEGSVSQLSRRLRKAAKDNKVKAVILQVNSPGGGLTASDLIHNEIVQLKNAGKPVVVWVCGLAASGGLYVSAPTDWIVASPTSLIGSIGVIMQRMEIKELLEKIGVKSKPIKSTTMKDLGSPFREMTQEEETYFSELINTMNEKFISIIVEGRHLSSEKVHSLASGKIFTAEESLEHGLIDDIGYFDRAFEKARELADASSPDLIKYKEPFDIEKAFAKFPFGGSGSTFLGSKTAIQSLLDMSYTPELRAVWQPFSE